MHVLALGRRILDRAREEEELVGRGAEGRLVKDNGVAVICVAGPKPGWQVPGDE